MVEYVLVKLQPVNEVWVIPCEINTKNGRMSQISLKLCAHIVHMEE